MSNDVTVIIPVFNEEDAIRDTLTSLSDEFDFFCKNYHHTLELKLLLIDDGSTDGTIRVIQNAKKSLPNIQIETIQLTRNWGHQRALWCGLSNAKNSKYIGVIDADGQDPPKTLFEMLARLIDEERDVVYGVRTKRKEGKLLRAAYALHYKALNLLSEYPVQPNSGDFCVMTKEFCNCLTTRFNELPDYIRGMRSFIGLNQVDFPYERLQRRAGESKYNFCKLLKLSTSGFTYFSVRPLHVSIFFGIFIAASNILILIILLIQWATDFKIFGFSPADVPGYTSMFLVTNFLIGSMLTFNGITSMYIGNIFNEIKGRPKFIEKKNDPNDSKK